MKKKILSMFIAGAMMLSVIVTTHAAQLGVVGPGNNPMGVPRNPTDEPRSGIDYVAGEVIALADSEAIAQEIAAMFNFEFLRYAPGVATYATDNPSEVAERNAKMHEFLSAGNPFPQLHLNVINYTTNTPRPGVEPRPGIDFVEGEVIALINTEEKAKEVATLYGLELLRYSSGVACFATSNPLEEVAKSNK